MSPRVPSVSSDAFSGIALRAVPNEAIRDVVSWPLHHLNICTPIFCFFVPLDSKKIISYLMQSIALMLPEVSNNARCSAKDTVPSCRRDIVHLIYYYYYYYY